jgi:hypothetical protein
MNRSMLDEMSLRHPTTWMSSGGVLARTKLTSSRPLSGMELSVRDARWSEAVAVGSLAFVEKVKSDLGIKAHIAK